MPSITDLLWSLGNGRALANVQAVLDARQREDWIVAAMAVRLERRATAEPARTQLLHGSGADARVVA